MLEYIEQARRFWHEKSPQTRLADVIVQDSVWQHAFGFASSFRDGVYKIRAMLSQAVGQGAYGTVCSAKDHVTGRKVAIKKISNCFDHDVDAR